jgi:Domain of unknown function (DUF3846)
MPRQQVGEGTERMSKTALQVASNGEVKELDLSTDSLKVLQTAVDGLIEPIDVFDNLTMWVNEEFLLRAEPDVNPVASAVYSFAGGATVIHGTVVFTGGTDEEGNTLGIDPGMMQEIKDFIASAKAEQLI